MSEFCRYPAETPLPEVELQPGERVLGTVDGVAVTVRDGESGEGSWFVATWCR